jgi:hypothetical protein
MKRLIAALSLALLMSLVLAGPTSPVLYAEGGGPMSLLGKRRLQECAHE